LKKAPKQKTLFQTTALEKGYATKPNKKDEK
jgi:hypothetical protein